MVSWVHLTSKRPLCASHELCMHDPRSKTMRIQNEMSGLGLKALRHTAANQPRPAALLTLCVVCSIGQLTLYIIQYSFLFACINSFSYTLLYYCFFRSCYKYPSKSIIIPSKGTLSPTYLNKHTQYTDYHPCTSEYRYSARIPLGLDLLYLRPSIV